MKLAEALQIRADLQKRINQLSSRLANNATVQEGSAPTENPYDILAEADGLFNQLESITERINITNSIVKDEDGLTLTALIARRDRLRQQAEMLRNFLYQAGSITPRRQSTDIRIVPTVNVGELRKQCDDLSKRVRETDFKIQQLNWLNDLM